MRRTRFRIGAICARDSPPADVSISVAVINCGMVRMLIAEMPGVGKGISL
jgi:hypothetical protein